MMTAKYTIIGAPSFHKQGDMRWRIGQSGNFTIKDFMKYPIFNFIKFHYGMTLFQIIQHEYFKGGLRFFGTFFPR